MNLIPNTEKIIVERTVDTAEMSEGGIYIPDDCKEDLHEGVVIAVDETNPHFKVGTYVFFNPYAGTELVEEGVKYLIISQDEVIAYKKN